MDFWEGWGSGFRGEVACEGDWEAASSRWGRDWFTGVNRTRATIKVAPTDEWAAQGGWQETFP